MTIEIILNYAWNILAIIACISASIIIISITLKEIIDWIDEIKWLKKLRKKEEHDDN